MAKNQENTATVEQTAPATETTTSTATETTTVDSTVDTVTPEAAIEKFSGKMKEAAANNPSSPFANKAVYGGQTLDGIVLIKADGSPVKMQRVDGSESDHSAFLMTIGGKAKHTFLTAAEYELIARTQKPTDLPSEDSVVAAYEKFLSADAGEDRAIAAVKLRMSLTQDGNVKAA